MFTEGRSGAEGGAKATTLEVPARAATAKVETVRILVEEELETGVVESRVSW